MSNHEELGMDPNRRALATLFLGAASATVLQACAGQAGATEEGLGQTSEALVPDDKIVRASTLGFLIGAGNAGANSTAWAAWLAAASPGKTLFFDVSGVYEFNQRLVVPPYCSLSGAPNVTLKCVANLPGTETAFVEGGASAPWGLDGITVDGSNLVDYVVQSISTNPPSAGPPATWVGVLAMYGRLACFRGFNVTLKIHGCSSRGGPVGFLLNSCNESLGIHLTCDTHTGPNSACIRILGSYGNGEPGRPDSPGGGRMSLFSLVCGSPGVTNGVDLDGVGECDIHGVTVEGSTNAAIRIRNKASAVRVFSLRSNSGAYAVEFNGCNNAYVWGSNGASPVRSKVAYKGGAQMCRAFVTSESGIVSDDIIQEWGDGPIWPGTVRPDGTVLTGANGGPPAQGRWDIGDIVWNRDMTPGKPAGWRCSAISPTAWVPFALSPPLPVVIPAAPGNGVQNADNWDTAISANSIYQINGGYNGKRITIVASGTMRISESAVGNIWIDGSVGPGQLFRNLQAGDTITLLRIPHATLGFAWREIAKSVSG